MDQERSAVKSPEPFWSTAFTGVMPPEESPFDIAELTVFRLKRAPSFSFSYPRGRIALQHLMATATILRQWSQPCHIQIAGLFHTSYFTGPDGKVVVDLKKRQGLQKLIGIKAERLVYLCGVISRKDFNDAVYNYENAQVQDLPLEVRVKQGDASVALNRSEMSALAALFASAEADEVCDEIGAPAIWLSDLSHLCSWVPFEAGLRLPIFDFCRAIIPLEAEQEAGKLYRLALERIGKNTNHALTLLAACSEKLPWVAEPFLWRAYLERLEGDELLSQQLAIDAKRLLDIWGTAWDKRLTYCEWRWVAERLEQGGSASHAHGVLSRVAPTDPVTMTTDRGGITTTSGPALRLAKYLNGFQARQHDPFMSHYPDIAMQPEFDPAQFPIVSALEGAFQNIKREVQELQSSLFFPEAEPIERTGTWDVLFFYERGRRNVGNCARCPVISGILDDYDPVKTFAGSVYISKFHPNTQVRNHRGPTNMRLRCHLGIDVPDGDCGLLCGGQLLRWQTGKCIVFNDALEHEAWNRTASERIVLIVDLWHPDLTSPEREMLRGLHNYVLTYCYNLKQYWENNEKNETQKRIGYD